MTDVLLAIYVVGAVSTCWRLPRKAREVWAKEQPGEPMPPSVIALLVCVGSLFVALWPLLVALWVLLLPVALWAKVRGRRAGR